MNWLLCKIFGWDDFQKNIESDLISFGAHNTTLCWSLIEIWMYKVNRCLSFWSTFLLVFILLTVLTRPSHSSAKGLARLTPRLPTQSHRKQKRIKTQWVIAFWHSARLCQLLWGLWLSGALRTTVKTPNGSIIWEKINGRMEGFIHEVVIGRFCTFWAEPFHWDKVKHSDFHARC